MNFRFAFLALGLALTAQAPLSVPEIPAGDVTPNQAAEILKRIGDSENFMASAEAHEEPQSLYQFFQKPEYLVIRGNPVVGYYSAKTFKWEGNRVAWLGFKPGKGDAQAISPKAWDAAFRIVAKLRGLTIDPKAPIKIQGACVGAVMEPTIDSPYRGVCIEVKFSSPTGQMYHRFSVGKPTIEDAIGASLDFVVTFARFINKPELGMPETKGKS